MSQIINAIAEGCDVRTNTEVASLAHDGTQWTATCVNGDAYIARVVVSSAPVPQTLNLLTKGSVVLGDEIYHHLSSLRYERCIAALVTTSAPIDVRSIKHSDVAYIGDNLDKGISPTPSYTIHATPDFSERMWEEDRHEVATHLARCVLGDTLPGVTDIDVHGWKFSRPTTQASSTFLEASSKPRLIMIGDAFGGASVEGAIISALDAAAHLRRQ
jgi:predicted NAD/FAD-dependent oxidoreductase